MAAASSMKTQVIQTLMLTPYPRSAGASSQRTPRRTPSQQRHNIPTNLESLRLSATMTTTTLSCLVHPREKVLRNRMANPRANKTHHHQRRRRRNFGSSGLSSPRHEPTQLRRSHWRRNASLPDLAGALIDFVRVSILSYLILTAARGPGGRNLTLDLER